MGGQISRMTSSAMSIGTFDAFLGHEAPGNQRSPGLLPETGRGTSRWLVEGISALPACGNDRFYYIRTANDIARGNMQKGNAVRGKPCFTNGIPLRPVAHIMADPVNLDGQPDVIAKEVEHVRSGGMLPAEFIAARPQS
jgi:hypothetical protein